MIRICGMRDRLPEGSEVVNTTSKAGWSAGLSPFLIGPCPLYDGYAARNMENLWQFSKVYADQVDEAGDPSIAWWEWARRGWADGWAYRYPRGKGARPLYSVWNGERYGYIEARKRIYLPAYRDAVRQREAFDKLETLAAQMADQRQTLWLRDFDGYDHRALGMTWHDVIHCETRKMGHAFVLAMMLEGVCPENPAGDGFEHVPSAQVV